MDDLYIIKYERDIYHLVGKLSNDGKSAVSLCNIIDARGTDHSEPHLRAYSNGWPQGQIIKDVPKNKRICKSCLKKLIKLPNQSLDLSLR